MQLVHVEELEDLVHLVNFPVGKHLNTGWRHPGTAIHPVSGIVVSLRCDSGAPPRAVRLASSETALVPVMRDGRAEVVVDRLDDHEIVVFEFDAR